MSQSGPLDIESSNPQIPTTFETDNGNAIPILNTLEVFGETVDNRTDVKPLYTTGSGNTVTINLQVGNAITGPPSDKNDAGIVSFDETSFSVDENGFVTFIGGSGSVSGLLSDQGLPSVDPDGNGDIGVLGGVGINTTGQSPATEVTVNLDVPVIVANGGTGNISLTDGGILLGSGTASVTVTAQPTNGQLLIGSTGGDPVLNTLTEGTAIDIANSPGSITISVDISELPSVATTYSTDSGSATPALNILNIFGGEGIDTSALGNTITVSGELATAAANVGASNLGISSYLNDDFSVTSGFVELSDTVVKSVSSDSGSATPSGHSFTIAGGTAIDTSATGSTVTISFDVTEIPTIATTYTADSGSATPALNNLNILGSGGITTSATGSTVTIDGSGISGDPPTNISNGLGSWNLGMTYSAGTVTIKGADGNNLSASNPGYITIRSNVTSGKLITYTLTSNYTFDDSAGTSVFSGSLFGFQTGDATAGTYIAGIESIPFFLYAVADNNDANLIFCCSRIPSQMTAASARLFNAASGGADNSYDLLALQSITTANYTDNEMTMVGSFEMNKTAGDDWTIFTVTAGRVGFGRYAQDQYGAPRGTQGAAANSYFLNNGGTAPTVGSGQASYTIDPWKLEASYNFSWNLGGSPAGAVTAIATLPISGESGGPVMCYCTLWRFAGAPSFDHFIVMLQRDVGTPNLNRVTLYKNDGTPAVWQLNELPNSDAAVSGYMIIPL